MSTIMKQIFGMSKILGYFGYYTDRSKNFQSKIIFLKFERAINYPILNEVEEGSSASHSRTRDGHSFCNKNFQILELMIEIKIVITLHVYLFLRQLSKNRSIVLTVFLKKAKRFQKICFLH